MKKKTFYYTDMLNDDFGNTIQRIQPLPQKYRYVSCNPVSRALSLLLYRVIARPVIFCYVKVRFHHRFVGVKAFRRHKGGCFLIGNHVTLAGDAFIPHLAGIRKRNYILTGKETSSLTPILPLLRAFGNIPLGQSVAQNVAMLRCVREHLAEGASITIYPEGHIWPYYTGIRPFGPQSFYYAVLTQAPVFCTTTCFQKKRFGKTPRITSYVDGPFYPKAGLGRAACAQDLRDRVFETMTARAAAHSTYAAYEYRKKECTDDASTD